MLTLIATIALLQWQNQLQRLEDRSAPVARECATSMTPKGSTQWWYHDYVHVGSPTGPHRAFQTMTKMSLSGTTWSPTNEEFHYAYDEAGRVIEAAFGQTPSSTSLLSNGTYYDDTHLATSRARAFYVYDPSGRLSSVKHFWDYPPTVGTGYQTDALVGNECTYGDYLGLKTQSTFLNQSGSNTHNFATDHVEQFGYDADLDYLTSASYDGGANTTNWTYDAAGNRGDVTAVDNLNRATTIGGVSRTYDILGNTLTKGSSATYTWDCLNRMTSFNNGTTTTSYVYRADGMRTQKGTSSSVYTAYAYDGQMPVEEFNFLNSYPLRTFVKVIRYGVGPRGIDRIERQQAGGTVLVGYPIYDAHGNNVATVMKGTSANAYTIGDQRGYDAWGGVRSGSTTGEPNGRHCASIGHLQDDESGLVYMRARYYEPSSGRFVSEDPARDRKNWYIYGINQPLNRSDSSGCASTTLEVEESTAGGAIAEGSGNSVGMILMGRAASIVRLLETKYAFLGGVLSYGWDKAGNAGFQFIQLGDKWYSCLIRLSQNPSGDWIVTYTSNGPNQLPHKFSDPGISKLLQDILNGLI
jgi:RHS repeat-associated protein